MQAITEVDPDIDVEVEEEVETDGDENVVVWREERETDDGQQPQHAAAGAPPTVLTGKSHGLRTPG